MLGVGVAPHELCPVDAFRSALQLVKRHIHVQNQSEERQVVDHYAKTWARSSCQDASSLRLWPQSERPKLINAGDGTTGTSFLACLAETLGFTTAHNQFWLHVCDRTKNGTSGASSSQAQAAIRDGYCTHAWDASTFLTDMPVSVQLVPLLLTNADSPVMLSLREPRAWRASRIAHHMHRERDPEHTNATPNVTKWAVPNAGCSVHTPRLGDAADTVAIAKLTYDSFAACVALGRGHKLLMLDLFTEAPAEVQARLHGFLLGRFAWTQTLSLIEVQEAWRRCDHH
jgi:hypothetical protein